MDISQLSNQDLLSALGQNSNPISSMSDADLLKAIGPQQNGSTAADIAKSGGIGLAKGVIGLLGMPGDLADLASKGYDALTGSNTNATVAPYANAVGSQNIQRGIEDYTGQFYQPQTTAGKYAQTIGEFAPAVVGGPESLATRVATRVVAPAVASEAAGQATEGTSLEPYARVAGALTGAMAPGALSRVISPTTVKAGDQAAVNILANEGVQLTAGKKSGSKVLQYMESELGDALGAGNKASAANEKALEQFTRAAFNRAGIGGVTRATPEVMDAALEANGNAFDSIAARNPSIPIPDFGNAAKSIVDDFKTSTNAETAPALEGFIKRITTTGSVEYPPEKQALVSQLRQQGVAEDQIAKFAGVPAASKAGSISGETYQTIQSQIARAARNATDPNLKLSLYDLRSALDNSVQTGLKQIGNSADATAWLQARQQYKNLLVLERALSKTTETASKGLVTPAALGEADKAIAGKRNYVTGQSTFSDLARAGNAKMKPLPQSGTAPRTAAHLLPSILGAGLGAGLGDITGVLGGVAAPALLGRAIMSKPVQAILGNQIATPLRQGSLSRKLLTSGIFAIPATQSQSQIQKR